MQTFTLSQIHGVNYISDGNGGAVLASLWFALHDPFNNAMPCWMRRQIAEDEDDDTPICTHTSYADGGRTDVQCGQPAEHICARCGNGYCEEHEEHAAFYVLDGGEGDVVCSDCIESDEEETADSL